MKQLVGGLIALCVGASAPGEDWPEWRGRGRTGVWTETGIVERFPEAGLQAAWRTPLRAGYAGPAVAAGRVFVTDFQRSAGMKGKERALGLDEKSGQILWTREWDADYGSMSYPNGPRATPTVDGDRVYVRGGERDPALPRRSDRSGDLAAGLREGLRDAAPDLGHRRARPSSMASGSSSSRAASPTPRSWPSTRRRASEIWRALPSDSEPGYAQPMIVEAGGVRRLIIWHPTAVSSLDPVTGRVHWQQPFSVNLGMTLATPVASGNRLLVSSFFNGSHAGRPAGARRSGRARAAARSRPTASTRSSTRPSSRAITSTASAATGSSGA